MMLFYLLLKVEDELLLKGFRVTDDDPRGFGRKWRSVEYERGGECVILFQHMRYTKPAADSPHNLVGVNINGWVSWNDVVWSSSL